jgi:hypothetical protein
MKGDYSRNSYIPRKNYRAVRMQQGRVLLDADWNEMVDIINDQYTAALRSIVGAHGGLRDGFKITSVETSTKWAPETTSHSDRALPDLYIHAGQYYVDGYSCTLPQKILFEKQPFFPGVGEHKGKVLKDTNTLQWLLYLDVWERHLTAIEDPDLAEPSLGGEDTTTRTQIIWQVKILPLKQRDPHAGPLNPAELPEWNSLTRPQDNLIKIKTGYASENELFRIEIHAGNDGVTSTSSEHATWKWSRNNASIAFPLQQIKLNNPQDTNGAHSLELILTADRRLQDQLQKGDCIEVECDDWVLRGRPGWLARIEQVEMSEEEDLCKLTITVSQTDIKEDLALLQKKPQHPLVRRWDQSEVTNFRVEKVWLLEDQSHLGVLMAKEQASLHPGEWVELLGISDGDDWREGKVENVSTVDQKQKISVALNQPLPNGVTDKTIEQLVQVPMRRWNDAAIPLIPGEEQILAPGITVQFPPGQYQAGDYWMIPIRSGASQESSEFTEFPQSTPVHAFAPLALLMLEDAAWKIADLRRTFMDLGEVLTSLESLQAQLEEMNTRLQALKEETDREYRDQEDEINILHKEITGLKLKVDQLPVLTIRQTIGRYRSEEQLEEGDVVAIATSQEDCVRRASREAVPIGVVAPRPDDFHLNGYSVVLNGPAICRINGRVKAGDLLAAGREPGTLGRASLWVRWFRSDRIVARAIDNPTGPDDGLINVYFMPGFL